MDLKDIVYNYRMANDLTMEEFAKRCGLSKGYISMLEAGRNAKTGKPIEQTFPTLKKLAAGMGITLDELMSMMQETSVSLKPVPSPIDSYDPEILEELQKLHDNPQLRMLLSASSKLTNEDIQFMVNLAKKMHREE